MTMITEIHTMSRYSYGAPRVHAELRLAWVCDADANVSRG
jgi:hypothetical protein